MGEDWKSRIDDLHKHREEQRVHEEERKRKEEQRKLEEKIAEHKRRFICHVCGKSSSGPKPMQTITGGEYGIPMEVFTVGYHFDKPTELEKCSVCNKWTCSEHIYKNICINCAKKL